MSHKDYRIFEKSVGYTQLRGELYIQQEDIASLFFDFTYFWDNPEYRDQYIYEFEKKVFRFFHPKCKRRSFKIKIRVKNGESPISRYTFERLFFRCYNECFEEIILPRVGDKKAANKTNSADAKNRPAD